MIEKLAELEAAAAAGDPTQLAVYADALQSHGDPRGELIAIDLHAASHGVSRELDDRRAAVLASWLGPLAAEPGLRFENGYVDLMYEPTAPELVLARVLGSPAGPYLRALELTGGHERIDSAISLLGVGPRPRLRVLAVTRAGFTEAATIPAKAATALIRATPALHTLVVRGFSVFGAFAHPGLRRARVAGWDALGSLAGDGPPLTELAELDFSFHRDFTASVAIRPRDLARLLRGVPALQRLDLSRNRRHVTSFAYAHGGRVDVFAFTQDLAIKRQLTHLTMPGPIDQAEAQTLQRTIDRMPALERLELAWPPPPGTPELVRPGATIVVPSFDGPGRPWLGSEHRDKVIVELGAHPHRVAVEPARIMPVLDAAWDRLAQPVRDAWAIVWQALGALHWDGQDQRPARITIAVRQLMEALVIDELADPAWCQLRDILNARHHELPMTVNLRRWFGW
jgi:uncharacterized protein (TIGR02996 family)